MLKAQFKMCVFGDNATIFLVLVNLLAASSISIKAGSSMPALRDAPLDLMKFAPAIIRGLTLMPTTCAMKLTKFIHIMIMKKGEIPLLRKINF